MGEFDLIRWIRDRSGGSDRVALGIGDDCAAVRVTEGREVLVTTDMLMDGRHFRLGEATPEQVGHKALAVNLSDIAAMAGIPIAAVVAFALPKQGAEPIAKGLHEGMANLADRFDVRIIGGDTNTWDGPLVVSVTLMGEVAAGRAIRRSGARAGDTIFVTGPLGGSLLGRHLSPHPRIAEALALRADSDIHAMIDLSDGLSSDLAHILEESGGLGAVLDEDAIPIHDDARRMAGIDGGTPLAHALDDGEDFELCFTVSPLVAERWPARPPEGVALHKIGTVTAEPALRLRDRNGHVTPIRSRGFDHLR